MIEILKIKFFILLLFILCDLSQINVNAQSTDSNKTQLQPRLVTLDLDSLAYQSIFRGAPETVSIHSGLVTLKPGETVGDHNTENYEEMLVIFSGKGQMTFAKGKTFNLKYGVIAYCPPHTEHNVKNTGSTLLKYIYIAANAKQ